MGKNLREITGISRVNGVNEAMIRAPEIGMAIAIGKVVYVKDKQGNILFILNADALLGYTPRTVTVRQAQHALTYNNMGSQIDLQTIR